MNDNKFCFALDLKDDPQVIEAYKYHHQNVPPEIIESIEEAGIKIMDIYLTGNRLFMIMEVEDSFDFGKKAEMDASNEKVLEWETLMSTLQQKLPWAKEGEKWVLMEKIFSL